jgi:hypothetical protein
MEKNKLSMGVFNIFNDVLKSDRRKLSLMTLPKAKVPDTNKKII